MSATGTYLIRRAEIFLGVARMSNTNETWSWLMEAVESKAIDLDALPNTPEKRAKVIDLFDKWADDICEHSAAKQASAHA